MTAVDGSAAAGTTLRPRGGVASRGAAPVRSRSRRPNRRLERSLTEEGFTSVAGLDEVGRGAWAGPVSVGVVVVPAGGRAPTGLRDSKLLTEEQREALFPAVTRWCADWSVGHASPVECDRLGMTAALRLAARRALGQLTAPPQVVAMDGPFDYVSDPAPASAPADREIQPATSALPQIRTVVKGDLTCVSIAAASIVAKVTRDRMMRDMAASFPGFDFDRNKGYPSPVHRTALAGFGLTSLHRRSWSYVDELAFR
jgi:ribonuclease HII